VANIAFHPEVSKETKSIHQAGNQHFVYQILPIESSSEQDSFKLPGMTCVEDSGLTYFAGLSLDENSTLQEIYDLFSKDY